MPVDYEKHDSVAYVTINNPQKANILDKQISAEIADIWKDIWDDRDVRVAILTAVGDRHFCAGHNLATRPDITEDERERLRAEGVFWPLSGTVNGTRIGADGRLGDHYPQIYKPVIGAINGWAAGRRILPDAHVHRHPHSECGARPVQVRAAQSGVGRGRSRSHLSHAADRARRRHAHTPDGRAVRRR